MEPTYPLFPVFAFFGFLLPLIPLPWHLQAWNSGTCFYMLWASAASLCWFVNTVVWHNNAINWAPAWCDIAIRVYSGASIGLPAASLCINRRLYRIACVQIVSVSPKDKRRTIFIDSLICVLLPLVLIALQYLVQDHRFSVLEDIGCTPAFLNTLPTIFLSNIWPILLGVISFVYCSLTLRAFLRRRIEFSRFLATNQALSASRYFRLMALSMTEMICTMPLSIFMLVLNITSSPLVPWKGIAEVHKTSSIIIQAPAILWRTNPTLITGLEATRWMTVACSFVFFAFFGFAEEARRNYYKAYVAVRKFLRIPVPAAKPTISDPKSLNLKADVVRAPSFVKPPSLAKTPTFERAPSLPPYTPTRPLSDTAFTEITMSASPCTSSFDDRSILSTVISSPTSTSTSTSQSRQMSVFPADLEKGYGTGKSERSDATDRSSTYTTDDDEADRVSAGSFHAI